MRAPAVGNAALRILVFQGSTRVSGPPRPARVGERVVRWAADELRSRGHEVDVVDPVETELPLLRKPHFAYAAGRAPEPLDTLAQAIAASQAFVMVTPEYNHAPSPALLNTLNHFGSSLFAFKPSAIVSYSQGQWGGARAAHSLRAPLSELGCLPVSAMVHVPKAHEAFDADGRPAQDAQRWAAYGSRTWSQLEWWASAAVAHRAKVNPFDASEALLGKPSQRNAPGADGSD